MRTPFIYALVDPDEPDHIRYIGLAVANELRPYDHALCAINPRTGASHKINWIRKLLREDRLYDVVLLEELEETTPRYEVGEHERAYILAARVLGHRLTNATAGGDGMLAPSEDTRANLRAAAKLRWSDPEEQARWREHFTPEFRAEMSVIRIETWKDPGRREQASRSAVQRFAQNPEQGKAISVLQTLRFSDPAERDKAKQAALDAYEKDPSIKERLRDAALRQWKTPGYRENLTPQQWSPEARRGIAESNQRRRGIPKSPEGRANMLKARRERVEREKAEGVVRRFKMDPEAVARRVAAYKITCERRKAAQAETVI